MTAMLGATFAQVKQDYVDCSTCYSWKEQLTNDGLPFVSYNDSELPDVLFCYYLQNGVVKKFVFLAMYDDYCQQFKDNCMANYKALGDLVFLDEENNLIWNVKIDKHGDSYNHRVWTTSLSAVQRRIY